MPLMPQGAPVPGSYRRDQDALWREIRALWQKARKGMTPLSNRMPEQGAPHPGIGEEVSRWDHKHGAGGTQVFVQPDEPEHTTGTIWYDTDEPI
jgi:hypothetical protein